LLPAESQQATWITQKIAELGAAERTQGDPPQQQTAWIKRMGPFAAIGAAAWKFKTFLLLALGKAKFLIFGLGKIKTVLSMALSMGYYWTLFGWPFAIGFVLGIYVHEMGHVWALHRLGLRASAPMFIPGVGALVLLKQRVTDPLTDAQIGLAGPVWGLGAAIVAFAVYTLTGARIWLAIAQLTGFLNLFNLIPVWQLDGSRGFHVLARGERWLLVAVIALALVATEQRLLFIVGAVAVWRALQQETGPGDTRVLATFMMLIVALAWLARSVG